MEDRLAEELDVNEADMAEEERGRIASSPAYPIDVVCEYCGYAGQYPGNIEVRSSLGGLHFCCADTDGCDRRDAEAREDRDE